MTPDLGARLARLTPAEAIAIIGVLDDVAQLVWDLHGDAIFDLVMAKAPRDPPAVEPDDDRIPF